MAGPVMSMLLMVNEVDRCLRHRHVEDVVAAAAGRDGQERLTAELLQRKERCDVEGFIPERFGLSFKVAMVATYLLEPGWDRHFGLTESVETLPPVVVVSGVVRRLIVVGVVPAEGRGKHAGRFAPS